MTRLSGFTRRLVLPLAGVVTIIGCSGGGKAKSDTTTTSKAASAAAGPIGSAPDPTQVVKLAKSYTFDTTRDPVETTEDLVTGHNKGVPVGQMPHITIETAINGGTPTDQEIIARIVSTRAYPGLGIGNNENYIWRNRNGSPTPDKWDVWLVSTAPPRAIWLTRGGHALTGGDPHEPRIAFNKFVSPMPAGDSLDKQPTAMIAYGLCIDDPNLCGGGHCGYNYQ